MRTFFFVFFILAVLENCFSQEPFLRHFGVEEGLPSSETYDILQDRNGFMWIGSDRGVSRYDGYSFHNFSSSDGLTDNTVFHLQEDTAGNIWCATLNGGLCYFSGQKFFPFQYNEELKKNTEGTGVIQSFGVSQQGDVLVGYQQQGCLKIDASGKTERLGGSAGNGTVVHEVYSSDDYFICGSSDRRAGSGSDLLFSLHIDAGGKQIEIALPSTLPEVSFYTVVLQKANGTILVGAGSLLIEIATGGQYRIHKFGTQIIQLNEDKAGNNWISLSGNGVRRFSPGADFSGNDFTVFLASETVTDVVQDVEGSYWMSTLDHGIYYLASASVHCLLQRNNSGFFSVTALATNAEGNVLLGTSNGWMYESANGKLSAVFRCGKLTGQQDYIQDIYAAPGGAGTWLCTNKAVLFTGTDSMSARNISGGFGRTLCGDGSGGCWVGGMHKIMHFNPGNDEPDRNIRLSDWVQEVYWDNSTGKLLVGLFGGLYWLNGNELEPWKVAGVPFTFRVTSIRRSGEMLVVGTIGSGLCIIKDDQLLTIGTAEGLCSPMVNDIDVDPQGNVWVATNAGLAFVDCSSDKFPVSCFSIFHGLPTNEISRVMCHNDVVWIGTTSGAAWFIPSQIEHSPVAPPIYIQDIVVNGGSVSGDVAHTLSFDENQVRISFLGISYRNGGNTIYRYRLTGLEQNWTTTTNRSVEFASLPPGDYVFEVMARNGDGTWSTTPATYSFSISKPFWLMWWFWLLAAIVLVGICWWAIHYRLQSIRNVARQRGILAEYQHQALAAQMNPHFIFNSLSTMQAFVLSDEKENALRYVDRFSFLMRKSLEHSMLKYVALEKEIELLRSYLDIEAMRFGEKLSYSITCESPLDPVTTEVPAMMVQPFVENAIRHGLLHREGPGGYVNVVFTWKENALWCCVEDNGVGRERSTEINRTRKKHISFGSSITEERLRLLCEVMQQEYSITYTDKKDQEGRSAGTTVYFLLPSRKRETHAQSITH